MSRACVVLDGDCWMLNVACWPLDWLLDVGCGLLDVPKCYIPCISVER